MHETLKIQITVVTWSKIKKEIRKERKETPLLKKKTDCAWPNELWRNSLSIAREQAQSFNKEDIQVVAHSSKPISPEFIASEK